MSPQDTTLLSRTDCTISEEAQEVQLELCDKPRKENITLNQVSSEDDELGVRTTEDWKRASDLAQEASLQSFLRTAR